MQKVDESLLEVNPVARFRWVDEFMGFEESDEAALHTAAPLVAPMVPGLVDAVYERLFAWSSVKRHLAGYLVALVTRPYDAAMVQFLDRVGAMHTPRAGSPALFVPLVQMNALMGFVSDAVLQAVLSLSLERAAEVRTLRAFNKLLWLQNDLITRHYQGLDSSQALPPGEQVQTGG